MNPEIGSLDDVVRDDRILTALGERRFGDVPLDDELTSTMVSWCQDLDFGLDAFAGDLPTPDLAKAAARRKAMQRSGRLVGAAAAVAAVCVGGLAVTHLTSSSATTDGSAHPAKTGAVATPSLQTREQIWRDLSRARDALVRQDWSTARKLLSSATTALPGVSADDGHDALQTWVDTLSSMLNNHTTIEPTASLGSVTHDSYTVNDHGVPMLKDMADGTDKQQSNLHQLPPLPPLSVPTGRSTTRTDQQAGPRTRPTTAASTGTGSTAPATSASNGSSTAPGDGSSTTPPGTSTPPNSSTPPSSSPPGDSGPGAEEPPLPPAPQIRINAPLLRQLLPQQPAPSTSPSSLPSTGGSTGATAPGTGTSTGATQTTGTTGTAPATQSTAPQDSPTGTETSTPQDSTTQDSPRQGN